MGFQFRKSKNLGAGTRLNVGKRSIGISSGVKGARFSVNSKGRAGISLSIPGTGIRYRKSVKIGSGGLVSGICSFLIGLFQIAFLLTWWVFKLVIWLMCIMVIYSYRGIVFLAKKAAGKLRRNAESNEE